MTEYASPVQLLADLVAALDRTSWSSWQSTATFETQITKAREYINQQEPHHD